MNMNSYLKHETPFLFITFILLILLGIQYQAQATMVFVENAGFEDPSLPNGDFVFSVPGWTQTFGLSGTYNLRVEQFPDEAPEGENVLFLSGSSGGNRNQPASVSQILTEVLTINTTYTLQTEVGNRLDANFSGYSVELLAGGNVLAIEDSLSPSDGTFETSILSFTANPGNPNLGQALEIRLSAPGSQPNFDNIRLDATVIPIPASVVLFSMGLIGLTFISLRSNPHRFK